MRINITKQEAEFILATGLTDVDNVTIFKKKFPGFYLTVQDLDENLKLRRDDELELVYLEANSKVDIILKILKERKTEEIIECERLFTERGYIYITEGVGCYKQAIIVELKEIKTVKFVDEDSFLEFYKSVGGSYEKSCSVDSET